MARLHEQQGPGRSYQRNKGQRMGRRADDDQGHAHAHGGVLQVPVPGPHRGQQLERTAPVPAKLQLHRRRSSAPEIPGSLLRPARARRSESGMAEDPLAQPSEQTWTDSQFPNRTTSVSKTTSPTWRKRSNTTARTRPRRPASRKVPSTPSATATSPRPPRHATGAE